MSESTLLPHLFRTEYSKIVAVLCKRFGIAYMETAGDIVSDTFLTAAETWGQKGIPPNPTAWLYAVAKNKTRDWLRHEAVFRSKIAKDVKAQTQSAPDWEIDLSEKNVVDSQLQMMFAICQPCIPPEAQIGLSLHILCGFGAEEIADAFLTNKDVIYKRLARAKEKLKREHISIELPAPNAIADRLAAVLTTLYLLFNEGYYSISQQTTIRRDLCFEAMRLCYMLIENPITNLPQVNALLALMCFHASRFDARMNEQGDVILYEDQDTSLWNDELITRGSYFLNCSAKGDRLSRYHLEAAIAYWNTQKEPHPQKWEHILQLYNKLLEIAYSPMAALNRTYALLKARGAVEAIPAAEQLALNDHHFYFALLGELYKEIDNAKALSHFRTALEMAKTATDKAVIQRKIAGLEGIIDKTPE